MQQSKVADGTDMGPLAATIFKKYSLEGKEAWPDTARRVSKAVMGSYLPSALADKMERFILARKVIPGGRYLYSAGKRDPMCNNCFLFKAEDSRAGWASLMHKITASLMTGGGIGVVYSPLRSAGSGIAGLGGVSTGPLSLMQMVNEAARHVMQGGSRRSAIWAGLHWWHPDVFKFIEMKNWSPLVRQCRKEDFTFAAPMDMTNISVILDDDFFAAYHTPGWSRSYRNGNGWHTVDYNWACSVYWAVVRSMLKTAEPGFSVDTGDNVEECLRNACTEVTSADDEDCCNLASLNLARIESPEELAEAADVTLAFLLCGTLYSQLPIPSMHRIREKNRRLGLGLMGVHEWMIRRGKKYGPDSELAEWLAVYTQSGSLANRWADRLGISRPCATRSIAPTGTISILAETTSGIEPLFAVAYKRRYLSNGMWKAQYVADPIAHRLAAEGHDPALIEDAMTLADDVERRIGFQAWVQKHVDQGISSTINLPAWGSSTNNEATVTRFGNTLLTHLPGVRGMTAYPDGSRDGQPLTRVPYAEALASGVGVEFLDNSDRSCVGVCAS